MPQILPNSAFMVTGQTDISPVSTGFRGKTRKAGIFDWFVSEGSVKTLEILSFTLFLVIGIATTILLINQGGQSQPLSPFAAASLLIANFIPATAILVLLGRRLALSRSQLVDIGSNQRLHVRLVAIFSLIAAIPTMLLVIFASLIFQGGVQFWFSSSARGMLENASVLAKGYYDEKLRDVSDETSTMAGDFRYILARTRPDDPNFLDAYFKQVLARHLSESAIISVGADGVQRTIAVVSPNDKRRSDWISASDLAKLNKGRNLIVSAQPDRIEATTILFEKPLTYLYANKAQTVPSFLLYSKSRAVLTDYRAMVARSRSLQLQFNIALYGISLLIIAITVWIALLVADRLVRPITNLVQAAEKIAGGDLSARVSEENIHSDEVGFLSHSFNLMTNRLQGETVKLLSANRQLDDRRAFIETVLESVTAGVISINSAGEISLANSTAENLLSGGDASIVGQSLANISPTLSQVCGDGKNQAVVQLETRQNQLTVNVKVARRENSIVITFEDISQQLADQRRAAWSDVARRIAHEIKNPLTPIQLAAERLQRRFSKQISDGADIFDQLTKTIVRQVGDLRNIVDEFSSFARMPKPVFRSENLNDIVAHAVFLFEVAHSDITFNFSTDHTLTELVCDRRQLGQAVTNIIKNAVESIQEWTVVAKQKEPFAGVISIKIKSLTDHIIVEFSDNGTGLPDDKDRIIEPYVTTRKSGSGLGLAIVKKIIEEHLGEITFSNAQEHGAIVTLSFSPQQLASLENREPVTSNEAFEK